MTRLTTIAPVDSSTGVVNSSSSMSTSTSKRPAVNPVNEKRPLAPVVVVATPETRRPPSSKDVFQLHVMLGEPFAIPVHWMAAG